MNLNKTYIPTGDVAAKNWHLVDADGKTLGRLASRIASVLRGKHKATYSPSVDEGDFVIVVNAEKVHTTGNKGAQKQYHSHSGYPGGLTSITLDKLLATKPEEVIKKAVWGMLPKGPLGRQMFKKLKVYQGAAHPHNAQKPTPLAD